MGDNSAIGCLGEELAARHLRSRGLDVLCRNWRCRFGEIDIVARDKQVELRVVQLPEDI